jgi:ribonuclease BN (tRNA processing enzyme)
VTTSFRTAVLAGLVVVLVAMWVLSFASKRLERVASGVAALEPRRFEELTFVAVGTGGTFENHLRLGPSAAVGLGETVLLVDAGRGTAQALRAAQIPVDQPVLLLTSLLPESTLGLDDWLWGATLAGAGSVRIFGPPGTRALVRGLLDAHAPGARAQAAAFGVDPALELDVTEAEDGQSAEIAPFTVRAFVQRGGPVPTLAWRLEGGGKSVAVSAAGFDADALVAAARDASLWVHEAVYGASLEQAVAAGIPGAASLAAEGALHTRLEDVGALATRAGARRLALVRLRPPPVWAIQYQRIVAPTYAGPVAIPEDGEEIKP